MHEFTTIQSALTVIDRCITRHADARTNDICLSFLKGKFLSLSLAPSVFAYFCLSVCLSVCLSLRWSFVLVFFVRLRVRLRGCLLVWLVSHAACLVSFVMSCLSVMSGYEVCMPVCLSHWLISNLFLINKVVELSIAGGPARSPPLRASSLLGNDNIAWILEKVYDMHMCIYVCLRYHICKSRSISSCLNP